MVARTGKEMGTAGDRKGPPHVHPTTLAPTDFLILLSMGLGDEQCTH
jgi:hypothetical protein